MKANLTPKKWPLVITATGLVICGLGAFILLSPAGSDKPKSPLADAPPPKQTTAKNPPNVHAPPPPDTNPSPAKVDAPSLSRSLDSELDAPLPPRNSEPPKADKDKLEATRRLVSTLAAADAPAADKLVSELAADGPDTVTAIKAELTDGNSQFQFRHRGVTILKKINSAESRALLKELALGQYANDLPSLQGWAAQAYADTAPKPEDLQPLCEASNPDVVNLALNALRGKPLNAALAKSVVARLESTTPTVRWAASNVIAASHSGEFGTDAISALAVAADSAVKSPTADKASPRSSWTEAETDLDRYINSLASMPATAEQLESQAKRVTGIAADVLAIALARRGESATRERAATIASNPKGGMMRAWAARSLGAIGKAQDVSLLKSLAATDSLTRDRTSDAAPPGAPRQTHPVREAAADALKELAKRGIATENP